MPNRVSRRGHGGAVARRATRLAATGAAYAIKHYAKKWLSGGENENAMKVDKKTTEEPTMTRYHEDHTYYKRKRAPKKVVRKARAFERRVDRILEHEYPSQIIVRPKNVSITAAAAQAYVFVGFKSFNGADVAGGAVTAACIGMDDISALINEVSADMMVSAPYVAGAKTIRGTKMIIDNAVLDWSITTSNNCVINVYECVARKDLILGGPDGLLSTYGNQRMVGESAITAATPYNSLFNIQGFCEHFIILKKNRIYADGSNYRACGQLRDRGNTKVPGHWFDQSGTLNCTKKGITKMLVFEVTPMLSSAGARDSVGFCVEKVATYNVRVAQTNESTIGQV